MLSLIVLLALCWVIDINTWPAIKTAFRGAQRLGKVFWGVHIGLYALIILAVWGYRKSFIPTPQVFLFLSGILTLYSSKTGVLIIRALEKMVLLLKKTFRSSGSRPNASEHTLSRSQFLSRTALGLAALPFTGLSYGMIKGKYDFKIRRFRLGIPHLPASFEGFTITQISDLHMGSFDRKSEVENGLAMVNEQDSDVILFTGDLINDVVKEVNGYEAILASLKAREGIYSIFGNHDYAEHVYHSPDLQRTHLEQLASLQRSLGWKLLRNESYSLMRGSDEMAIIGVENWSTWDRFPRYGDLGQALAGTENAAVKLLLSHDPTHWMAEVLKSTGVDITFSGHTHGCQLGIEVPGWKWSPVQYFYEQWAGLYMQAGQYLYVNRGLGFVGFSGRLGIRPEITVLELVRGPHGYQAL